MEPSWRRAPSAASRSDPSKHVFVRRRAPRVPRLTVLRQIDYRVAWQAATPNLSGSAPEGPGDDRNDKRRPTVLRSDSRPFRPIAQFAAREGDAPPRPLGLLQLTDGGLLGRLVHCRGRDDDGADLPGRP